MAILVIETDGTRWDAAAGFAFADAQRVVGGLVEAIPMAGGYVLVNEEGVPRRLSPNRAASAKAGRPLVGPAIFLSGHDVDRVLGPRE